MDINKKIESHASVVEKVIIITIFFTVLLSYMISDAEFLVSKALIVLQLVLIIFYGLQLNNKLYVLLWIAFALGVISYFFVGYIHPLLFYFSISISYVAFGLIVLIRAFGDSIKHKNFELLNFIMGFLLVMQVAIPFISKEENLVIFYTFALAFAIGTIIYNDNLWHRYNADEKNIIKYILIVALVIVLQSSFKYLNI